jgi:hypothetical protein
MAVVASSPPHALAVSSVQCPRNMWTVLRVYGAIGKDEFHNV